MISRETILKLLALEAKTIVGPWDWGRFASEEKYIWETKDPIGLVSIQGTTRIGPIAVIEAGCTTGDNFEFIAESRNHLKALCDSYLKLLDERERAKDLLKRTYKHLGEDEISMDL